MAPYDRYPAPSPQRSLLLWLLLFGAIFLGWRWWSLSRSNGLDPNAVPRAIMARGDLAEDEKSTIALFRQASPSVVHITTLSVRQDAFSLDLLQIPQGTGTGFFWDQEGHIVTNYHVIQGADAARVTLADHSTWNARLVGAHPDKDIAVVMVDAPKDRVRPIPVGTSKDLQVGQKAFAIGNPFGLDQSLTIGVVSALGREIASVNRRPIKDVIQTDAAINPGNSGGPLLDSAGRLIGMNAAIYSPSGTFAGIGFAIPVDEINRVVPQLIKHGRVVRPGLGVQVAHDQLAQELGLKGVLVVDVQAGSPAEKAGLQPTERDSSGQIRYGDVITAIDDQPVRAVDDLFGALENHKVGDTVVVTVERNGAPAKISVTLDAIRP